MTILILFLDALFFTILMIGSLFGLFKAVFDPMVVLIFWIASIICLVAAIYIRKHNLNKFKKEVSEKEESPYLRKNEYFYQAPFYLFGDMHIKIHGLEDGLWKPYFNNNFLKWLSDYNFISATGVKVTSMNNKVILKRTKLYQIRPYYQVFLNDKEIGTLEMERLIKGGIKQQTPFVFKDKHHTYKFHNAYFSTSTTITNEDKLKILKSNRSIWDLSTNSFTNRKGETHNIKLTEEATPYPVTLWIGLYIQVMINKQQQK
ncbi:MULTISPECIES: hypothetical protein [Staphylococcus]|uniref:DUF3137 domain-containing protein n=1 Tax=Staphylococcus hsinchuensis TaxID=3051183 RepID=A0ABZ3EEP6_9STAP|nr:hypothetical protein [Staphylococcus sp. Marseille-Q6910]